VLVVGALAVEPATVRVVAEHADRLHLDVQGTAVAVVRWVDAIRSGDLQALEVAR